MGVNVGPNLVTDGLVLCLDKYNDKSYLGEPTNNEARYYPTGDNEIYRNWLHIWANSGAYSNSNNATDVPKPKGFENSPIRITSSEVTTVGSLHFANGLRFVTGNTQYSFSIYFRQNRAGVSSSGYSPYMRGGNHNYSFGLLSYNGSTTPSTWPVDEWIRLEGTMTAPSNADYLYISHYLGTYVGDKAWLFAPQIEQKPHVTKFVYTERLATDGWRDLSGNDNHADLTALTYSSTNVPAINSQVNDFSFDGVDEHVRTDSLSETFTSASFSVWFKLNGSAGSSHRGALVSNYNGTALGKPTLEVSLGNLRLGHFSAGSDVDNVMTPELNTWYHVVATMTATTSKVYVNGVLEGSATSTYSSGTMDLDIGARNDAVGYGYAFYGEISTVKVYNRALTATEILQNFNAHKGRYGL